MVSQEEIVLAEAAELISGILKEEKNNRPLWLRILKALPFMLRDLPWGIANIINNLP